ncbi:MAG: FAD-dependent oxidoreductase [Rhodospirillaceae bacterium]|nr:FAD-dependent oxidoreductase [Rhodospirillaceae bacterium]
MATTCDFLIIGGGIAGASAAYELARLGSVILLERESQPGYHTTGRSAAFFTENYGNRAIRGLTIASRSFLTDPPDGFTEHPLMLPGGIVFIARADQAESYREAVEEARLLTEIEEVGPEETVRLVPVLRPDYAAHAFFEPEAMYMDVALIHRGFLRGLTVRGGRLVTDSEVTAIAREGSGWRVEAGGETYAASTIVNAAGAWADVVAGLAGVPPIGLMPKRRTVIIYPGPDGKPVPHGPMVIDVDEQFYFKPEAGKFLASPADETPSPPCDAQPEELDIATVVDRVERAVTFRIGRIEHSWAGLRSFVADRSPVMGPDPAAPGFFWLAGQGGYGIMTSPAMGRAVASLAGAEDWPADLTALDVTAETLAPRRPGLT